MNLFDRTSYQISKRVTNNYSTSFSLGIKVLSKKFHDPIYAIYGLVRYADEIVDTFHDYDKGKLLKEFKSDTYTAIEQKISLNPILQSFQLVVNEYNIDHALIEAFFASMEMDLEYVDFDQRKYDTYIYGSAEVVGLMCLHVFCNGNQQKYKELESSARSLGAAFQKVNFLRDINSDFKDRGRVYFPGVDLKNFDSNSKLEIEKNIKKDFDDALIGIKKLPKGASIGVYLAYIYYLKLFSKIKSCQATEILSTRIRVPNFIKIMLLMRTYLRYKVTAVNNEALEISQ